jgi:hypothetical protein
VTTVSCLVPMAEWRSVWPMARPMLAPAFDHGRDYSADDAPERLASGEWGLWVTVAPGALKAAAITEIVDFPRRRKLWVIAAGGDRPAIRAMWPLIQNVAAEHKCAVVAWSGRHGWRRSGVLPDSARHAAEVMEIAI